MPRFAANLSMMFTERPFLDRFAAAAEAGFEAVEFLSPYAQTREEVKAALDAAGLQMALYNTPAGDWEAGERGAAALPGQGARFDQDLAEALRYAEILQPERLHVMAGRAEGPAARDAYLESLAKAVAADPARMFVIEPINSRDMPGYHLATSADAATVLDAVGAPNLKIQLDLYHCQIMEGDLTRRIEALGDRIGHVQIAGVPDRHEPDEGELNLAHLLRVLDAVGYAGWIGCEYRPKGRTEDGLGWITRVREDLS